MIHRRRPIMSDVINTTRWIDEILSHPNSARLSQEELKQLERELQVLKLEELQKRHTDLYSEIKLAS